MQVRLLGNQSVYIELADEIKRYVRLGVIKADEKLPSCRALGVQLGINPATVERAYSVLEADGYVKLLPKKGAFVCYARGVASEIGADAEAQIQLFKAAGLPLSALMDIAIKVYKN